MNALPILAFCAGSAIAVQASMNAQLGVLLKSSMLGTGIAFLFACFFTVLVVVSSKQYPLLTDVKTVPIYLWFSGGAIAAFGVGVFYYLIPKMGVGSMMSFALSGQILTAIISSHFGWFDQPTKPIDSKVIIGTAALVVGILLINWESSHDY
ncbi:DMT family transporter [Sessilibacter corallicola]|uniref:DMT family transporter n=1 Tax=Sessilibacter corallicola TaxID=2904075 RepID=A0ABQ0AAG1_9GAMM|nr:DMT family transporter [Sessilibacter corallicola]